eukprot:COSAG01_NODE_39219_length_479_cov_1.342105_1_plen_154_part_01
MNLPYVVASATPASGGVYGGRIAPSGSHYLAIRSQSNFAEQTVCGFVPGDWYILTFYMAGPATFFPIGSTSQSCGQGGHELYRNGPNTDTVTQCAARCAGASTCTHFTHYADDGCVTYTSCVLQNSIVAGTVNTQTFHRDLLSSASLESAKISI